MPAAVPATEPVAGPPIWLDMLPVLLVAAVALLGLALVSALLGALSVNAMRLPLSIAGCMVGLTPSLPMLAAIDVCVPLGSEVDCAQPAPIKAATAAAVNDKEVDRMFMAGSW